MFKKCLKLIDVLSKIKTFHLQALSQCHMVIEILRSKGPQSKRRAESVGPKIRDMINKTSYKMFLA